MPPKKKGKKAKKPPMLIDGVDTSTMTRDELEAFALRLKAEMEREREERNFFQLERDKIRTFWEIARAQLEEITTELRLKDREVEKAEELADIEKKQITQQMKHLQYENHNKIGAIRAEAMTQLKLAQEEYVAQEQELEKDKRELRAMLREKEQINHLQMHILRVNLSEKLNERRMQFEYEIKDMALLYDIKMQNLKADVELVCRMQMFEVEERKNMQIQKLIASHEEAFNDMKNYYNDITLNNLGLISSLKEQMDMLRKQAERSERFANETLAENRRLKEPLEQAQVELSELRRKMEHFERDRMQLSRLKQRNTYAEKQLTALTWETEALLLRNKTLVEEREQLKEKFDGLFLELQQKTGLKTVLLERKLAQMRRDGEKREVLLQETLAVCAPETKEKLEVKIENVLDEKNREIQELRYELARICKAHDDLLATYESKLKQYDIPLEDLGFEPLRLSTKWKYLCGPAGLVTKNQ